MLMTCGIKYATVSHQEAEPPQAATEPATNNPSLGKAETAELLSRRGLLGTYWFYIQELHTALMEQNNETFL